MKTFRRILTFLIFLAAAGAIFYFGWIQYRIDMDTCGVMISKTSGVYKKPIEPGVFAWRWEPLIPGNAKIRVFSLSPKSFTKVSEGFLPSANIYSLQIKSAPDFSYKFEYEMSLRFKPTGIVQAVKKTNVSTDEELNLQLDSYAELMSTMVTEYILDKSEKEGKLTALEAWNFDYESVLKEPAEQAGIEIVNFKILSSKIPDFELYGIARQSFMKYREAVEKALAGEAAKEARAVSEDSRNIQKLEKMGELLRRYPELVDVIKSGTSIETLQSLQTLQ